MLFPIKYHSSFIFVFVFVFFFDQHVFFAAQTKGEKPDFFLELLHIQSVEEVDDDAFSQALCFQVSLTCLTIRISICNYAEVLTPIKTGMAYTTQNITNVSMN